ncbi:MAG: M14 family metallopeptidase [Clostridia bacterium]
MVENIATVQLPVDELMRVRRNRLEPVEKTGKVKRICIVTGTHGDELEGQYVCYELQRRINQHPEQLTGVVDIYPALNPLGVDSITRGIPMFDLDMNRIFPGNDNGSVPEHTAAQIIDDIMGADMCIDIHSSNIFLMEIPQVRINNMTADALVPYAKMLGVDFIWVHASATVLQSTLAHSLNSIGVPTLVVEMGVGMRITRNYGDNLVNGILNLMKNMGIWRGEVSPVKEAVLSSDGGVDFLNAEAAGVFVPDSVHGQKLKKGDLIGNIIDPLEGKVVHRVESPCDGMLFTLREYPMVYEGALLGRILREGDKNE